MGDGNLSARIRNKIQSIWSWQKLYILKILDLGTARALQMSAVNSSFFGPFNFTCLLTSLHAPQ